MLLKAREEPMSEEATLARLKSDYAEKYGFRVPEDYVFKARKGLDEEIVREISWLKGEPEWMLEFRLKALEIFWRKPMPTWGADLSAIDFDDIYYYIKPIEEQQRSWDDVPEEIKSTFDRLGIPEAERKFLAGVGAQYESEVVYHSIQKHLEEQGVIFLDTDTALKEHPELFKEYFGTIVPPTDNKFAALNSAVWSGGSFIYVPPGVHVELPLQAYFRINAQNMGQFERTLIIADEGSYVHYVEGCLPVGEQVTTGERWVNIEAIHPGDTVLNGEGFVTEVQAVRTRPFRGELVEIRPLSPGNTFRLTPDHPVLAVRRERVRVRRKARRNWLPEVDSQALVTAQPEYVPAGELERGDFLVFPVSKVVRDDPLYTTDVMRLLGYYLAEGSAYIHTTLNVPVVSFSLGIEEREAIEEIKSLVQRVVGKKAYEVKVEDKHAVTLSVYSRELMELCISSCGKGATQKRLSKVVMELPPEKQAHLLETYFLGDGSIYRRGRTMVRASTASRILAAQLQELLARQGIYASIMVRRGGRDTIQGRTITRRDQYILYYAPHKQRSEVRFTGDAFLVPIKQIARIPYDGPVFNFEVAGAPNAYLVRGFVVHNCTAPIYSTDSLHAAVVEIIVKKGARVRYTTIQNWSHNVYNLVTKRAVAYEEATMEWVDGNLGSKITMKYPAVYLLGKGAHGEVLSIAFAGRGQHQDAGAKIVHAAPYTSSKVTSKSISMDGGRASYRGLLKVHKGAHHASSHVVCDALLLDERSRSDTYPYIEIDEEEVTIGHEATVSKIGEDQLFYLMSRGLTEEEAITMVVSGFIEPMVKELPMEYAVEMNRLIRLQMEGSIG